jgi:hypothetical protein
MPDPQFDFSDQSDLSGGGSSGFNFNNAMGWGGIGDLLGAGMMGYGMSQYQNPANAGMGYLNQATQQLPGYFNPYIQAGQKMAPQLQQQYGQLMNNPGGVMNRIGAGFQQSPGYQFQVNQAMGAANRAASAGGMLGSPMEQQNIAGTVNGLANQDYYNYLNHGMSMYDTGLQGAQSMYGMGYDASKNLGEDMTNLGMSQAQLAYAGMANQNQQQQGSLGGIDGLLGGAASAIGGWL